MGCRILFDEDQEIACLYCSCSGVAFGELFHGHDAQDDAQCFIDWIGVDPRVLSNALLFDAQCAWLRTHRPGGQDRRENPIVDDASLNLLGRVQQEDYEHRRRHRMPHGVRTAASVSHGRQEAARAEPWSQ